MKVVILAGGYGTRISEEAKYKPKPMIEIGGLPILHHIMKIFSSQGFNEFIICAGYKQEFIKRYFADYFLYSSDVTFDFTKGRNDLTVHKNESEEWKVTVVNTGIDTMTGGRVKRIEKYLGNEPFILTYGDGVADIDLQKLVAHHKEKGKLVTMSAYKLEERFGLVNLDAENNVSEFREKSSQESNLINIGFMVCEPKFLDYIDNDNTILEKEPLVRVAKENMLSAYIHNGFWQCMDTLKEKDLLEKMWLSGNAPWKVWL